MGWSFAYRDIGRKAHIEEVTSQAHFSHDYVPIDHRVIGNHVWQLVLHKPTNRKLICLDLIAKARGEGWGYKGMSEDMGPYYYDCPLALLDKADAPPEGCAAIEWRQKVREYHKQRKAKPEWETGMRISYGGKEYRLHSPLGPRRGWSASNCENGNLYRFGTKALADSTIIN